MKKEFICKNFPHILHGGDYNPDQWTDYPDVLDEDMRLMKLSGCNTMTVGIFSWAKLEPSEGVFDFSFLPSIIINTGFSRLALLKPAFNMISFPIHYKKCARLFKMKGHMILDTLVTGV